MLETEKREYPLYKIDRATSTARFAQKIRGAIYFTSDRRDEDQDGLCVYIKKTYKGICDKADISKSDIIIINGERARVISVSDDTEELILHLESVDVIDTGAVDFEEVSNV